MSEIDVSRLFLEIDEVCATGVVEKEVLARSILGKEIPVLRLGRGKSAVVYVAAQRGTEGVLSAVLLDFVRDYVKQYQRNGKPFGTALSYLFAERTVFVIPMLNPDGVGYVREGVLEDNPLSERVRRMSGENSLSAWEANARGVDLTHNYSTGFFAHKELSREEGVISGAPRGFGGEYPESEPESAALCRWLRFRREDLLGVLALQAGKGEIYCSCKDKLSAKTMAAGRILGRATGYRLIGPESAAPEGGLADWCIEHLSRPAYRVECDVVKYSQSKARACLFEALRPALYTFPFML